MPQIKILPPGLRNKIAAGEVVERPASVVKELVENSIDAGSTDIRIEVLHGGKRLIRVSDNGNGMDREDALLAFERHATSKLFTEDDLFNIRTMGFRGEALPSIASVSKVKFLTGLKGSPSGVSVEIHGGETKDIKDSPFLGSTVEVKDLFFNTPARKKFLKSHNTELFHIIDTITREALSHWGIGFRFVSDNQETINLPSSSDLKERIMQVYGKEFLDGLFEVNAKVEGIIMKSFVTKAGNFRNSKSHQFIFVNRRPIKDQSLTHAIYRAYEGILPRDKHPIFFLFLEMDPRKVDFNVHPTKREVRFEDKEDLYSLVSNKIRETLRVERAEYVEQFMGKEETDVFMLSNINSGLGIVEPKSYESLISENLELAYKPQIPFIYLGDTFLALSAKGGLILIDHHAAHERILYEKFLKRVDLKSHHLLFPRQVRLSHKEYRIILENIALLRDFGIEVDDFGGNTIIVRTLPDMLKKADIGGILSDVASSILGGIPPDKSLREFLAAKIACHSSVRGKEILGQEEISALVADLEKADNPDQCPHGRPTRIFLSLDDLKRMFKRR
ncbi:MAG: DNA mismatch repair endonuclease MutL [Nitrospirota bacterium]